MSGIQAGSSISAKSKEKLWNESSLIPRHRQSQFFSETAQPSALKSNPGITFSPNYPTGKLATGKASSDGRQSEAISRLNGRKTGTRRNRLLRNSKRKKQND